MNPLLRFVNWIFEPGTDQWAEAYLAGATDLRDLERRMRHLNAQRPIGPFGWNA